MVPLDDVERYRLDLLAGVVPLVAACLSALISAYLIRRLRRQPAGLQSKLLCRQLLHLAIAILIDKVTESLSIVADLAVLAGWRPSTKGDEMLTSICLVSLSMNQIGVVASLLVECHIAIIFAASIFKRVGTLRFLSNWLHLVWLFAVLMALTCPFYTESYWAADYGFACEIETDWLGMIAMCSTFVVCFFCYAVSSCRACKAGWQVKKRVWFMTQSYIFVAMLTTLPYSVHYVYECLLPYNDRIDMITYIVAETLQDLNGIFYFSIYMFHNRSGRRLYAGEEEDDNSPSDRIARELSFPVTFRSTLSVRGFDSSSGPSTMEEVQELSEASPASRVVGEDEDDDDVDDAERRRSFRSRAAKAAAKASAKAAGDGTDDATFKEALAASMELKRQRSRGGRSPRGRSPRGLGTLPEPDESAPFGTGPNGGRDGNN